ncbi:hypothetical protein DPEC_G00359040 [Dallia pectoralis]|uniref:Uncharacterized protein n=1 Tax=Dallia pectoralis TaxID=75939 RepID=A0ACC2F0L6_DALPE|nr:hypothetical protein DPEC_G00359040 [Dallia pectoralis]
MNIKRLSSSHRTCRVLKPRPRRTRRQGQEVGRVKWRGCWVILRLAPVATKQSGGSAYHPPESGPAAVPSRKLTEDPTGCCHYAHCRHDTSC